MNHELSCLILFDILVRNPLISERPQMQNIWLACWLVVAFSSRTEAQDYDLLFPGNLSTGDFVQTTVNSTQPLEAFTVCLWLRPFENSSAYQVIVSMHPNQTAPNDFVVLYNTSNKYIQLWISDKKVELIGPNLLTGTWHHICVAWNATYGCWMLMVDGEAWATDIFLSDGFLFPSTEIIDLGHRNAVHGNQSAVIPFHGQISSFYFWVVELKLTEMRAMFERCQPLHDTHATVNWKAFLGLVNVNSSVKILKPSRCHCRENVALYRGEPKQVTDGVLDGVGVNSSTINITLSQSIWISEVFVHIGLINSKSLFVTLNTCGLSQHIRAFQSAVFYCTSSHKTLTITINSTEGEAVVDYREVLIFGDFKLARPIAVFPLSRYSPVVMEFGTNDVKQLPINHSVSYDLGLTNQPESSIRFSSSIQNALEFFIDSSWKISCLEKSFTISTWINFDSLPTHRITVFSFKSNLTDSATMPVGIEIDKYRIIAYYGKDEQNRIYVTFKTGIWYHVGIAYSNGYQICAVFRDEVSRVRKCQITAALISSVFVVGSLFSGRMTCLQIYHRRFEMKYLPELSYHCIHGNPATPPPILLFPFSSNDTYSNAMDVTMKSRLSGSNVTAFFHRRGIINEPLNAMMFSPQNLTSLTIVPDYDLVTNYATTVAFWLRFKNIVPQKCFIYRQHYLNITVQMDMVLVSFKAHRIKESSRLLQLNSSQKGLGWMFVVFSFENNGGLAKLEINGELEDEISSPDSYYYMYNINKLDTSRSIEIGKDCNIYLACLQVYNVPLTDPQKTMAKYRCIQGREGVYKPPRTAKVSVTLPEVLVSWKMPGFVLPGIKQGCYVKVTDTRISSTVSQEFMTQHSHILLNGLELHVNYSVQIQVFGQQNNGPSTESIFFVIPLGPARIVRANATGTSFVTITWEKSLTDVLGYSLSLIRKSNEKRIMVCSNETLHNFTSLTAMTEYQIDVRSFDGKAIGSPVSVTVKTDDEAPRSAPSKVRAYNVKHENEVHILWDYNTSLDLRATIIGFEIRVWLKDSNNTKPYKVFSTVKKHFPTSELHLDKNYTIKVFAKSESSLGPASTPITNVDEKAAFLRPNSLRAYVTSDCTVHLYWKHPYTFPLTGINRVYRITYNNSRDGSNLLYQNTSGYLAKQVKLLKKGETYVFCVAVQTIPHSPFGPCSHNVRITMHCHRNTGTSSLFPSGATNSQTVAQTNPTTATTIQATPTTLQLRKVSNWSKWTTCSQTCSSGHIQRSRVCLLANSSCTEHLNESQQCNLSKCPVSFIEEQITLSIDANFTDEKWDDKLVDTNSSVFHEFQSKTCQNFQHFYGGLTCSVEKCWEGSVMATLHANFSSLSALQILELQESLELNGALGNMSVTHQKVYSSSVPTKGPEITLLKAVTAMTAQLSWKPINVSYLHGTIQGYKVSYRPTSNSTWTILTCGIDSTSMVVDHLQPSLTYRFRVQTSNKKGIGIAGKVAELQMPALVSKNVPPSNVIAIAQTSTAIGIQWESLPDGVINGVFLGYRVLCVEERSGNVITKTTPSFVHWVLVDGLEKHAWHSVRVFGYSDEGMGFSNPSIRVRTLEDVPSAPPSNVVVRDKWNTSSLEIRWDPVPDNHRNGLILGYKLKYRMVEYTEHEETKPTQILIIAATAKKVILENLESSAIYELELLAYTAKGDGKAATVTGATCKCKQDIFTNYWYYPPYLSPTPTGIPGGIFGSIVEDMLLAVCGDCVNGHRRSTVHFTNDGKGNNAHKPSQTEVVNEIDDTTDVSFPIRGYVTNTKYMRYYGYISLVESPGIAYLAIRQEPTTTKTNALFHVIVKCWMLVIMMFSTAILVGMAVWATVSQKINVVTLLK